MEVLYLLAGILMGGGVIYFLKTKKGDDTTLATTELEKQLLVKEEVLKQVKSQLDKQETENKRLIEQLKSEKQEELNVLKSDYQKIASEQRADHQRELEQLKIDFNAEKNRLLNELQVKQTDLDAGNKRMAGAEEQFKNQREKITLLTEQIEENNAKHRQEVEELQKRMTVEFENIANKILEEKSKKFTDQNKINIEGILSPLRDRIKDFEEKVDKSYKEESNERVALKTEIRQLVELNKQVSEEANNLARALKGDNKMQGNWGEVILEKILERSGLVKDVEYNTQSTTTNSDGNTIKPDVIINLPDNKHIVIDSKVSLVAFEALVNCDIEEDRPRFLKEHLASVRAHIKGLSEKNYQTGTGINTPDFVLLFVPIESSFSLTIREDQELFSFAWDKKIVMVSPTTLLATLRTIASMWTHEKQNRNTFEIARQAAELYDKFVGFGEDMLKIGDRLDQTSKSYDEALKKLSTGSGNLVRRVESLKKLGVKANKSINDKLLLSDEDVQE